MPSVRLQKLLAQAGIASRRKAETLITEGRVTVDGKIVVELGARADPEAQKIEVDGRPVTPEVLVYLVFHKPRNVVSTMSDPEGRPTVAEYLRRVEARVVPVGRLDFHTSGTLLLTNDGDLAMALLHPAKESPKVYVAKVAGKMTDSDVERFERSIEIDGRPTRPAEVELLRIEGDKTWLQIVLREGKNRQIHRLGEATGFPVMRLARLSFAGITDEGLRPGEWRHLTVSELQTLKRSYGVPRRLPPPPSPERPGPRHSTVDRGTARGDESLRRNSRQRSTERRPAPAGLRPEPRPSRRR